MPAQLLDFHPLSDDLLTTVCRFVGINAALTSLLSSTRLHRAWQRAVESLTIEYEELTQKDISIIKKYTGLKELKLESLKGPLSPWLLIGQLAPSLTQITKLDVYGDYQTYDVLKTIHFSEGLRARLQHLCLEEIDYKLSPGDLCVLKDLPALVSLGLACAGSNCSKDRLPDLSDAFKSLSAMTMTLLENAQLEAHVLAVFPGSISSLKSLHLTVDDDLDALGQDKRPVYEAFSALRNLEALHTDCFPDDPAIQQQVLLTLSRLTSLQVPNADEVFSVPDALQHLRELDVYAATVDCSIFSLASLERVKLGQLQIEPSWHMRVADGCPLKQLNLIGYIQIGVQRGVSDESLRNLPTLPQLQTLVISDLEPANGGYSKLASVLRRHASTLRDVDLGLAQAFGGGLPRELPVCSSLIITCVGKHTLDLLSMCSLPALERMTLEVVDANVDARSDLWWLEGLPSLRCLVLPDMPDMGEFNAQLRAAVAELLARSDVDVRGYRQGEWPFERVD